MISVRIVEPLPPPKPERKVTMEMPFETAVMLRRYLGRTPERDLHDHGVLEVWRQLHLAGVE